MKYTEVTKQIEENSKDKQIIVNRCLSESSNERNYTGVQYADERLAIEGKYTEAHDLLSLAYYGFWKVGKSFPVFGVDVQGTLTQSKELFDKIHEIIFHKLFVKLNEYCEEVQTNEFLVDKALLDNSKSIIDKFDLELNWDI